MTSVPRQVELRYDPVEIDRKWQERWAKDDLYQVEDNDPRPKWYDLTMYPYPSGDLHIGALVRHGPPPIVMPASEECRATMCYIP